MKTDKFTRVLLTIIAINLTFLSLKDLDIIPKAYAEEPSSLYGLSGRMNYGLIPLNKDGTIDVTIKSVASGAMMDVNIEKVDDFSTFGKIPIEIKGQPVEVKIVN